MMSKLPAVDYQKLEVERERDMKDDLTRKLEASTKSETSGTGIDVLSQAILNFVVAGNYETAKQELQRYIDERDDFPIFQDKSVRYVSHCTDLINAVETKRAFPGLSSLSLAKQQEIHEKVMEHFEELKDYLKQIEKLEREEKLLDVRSTVWFVKALTNAVLFVTSFAFAMDITGGLAKSFDVVFDKLVMDLTSWVVKILRL